MTHELGIGLPRPVGSDPSAALWLDRVSLPLFLASALSIRIRFPLSLRNPSRIGENYSTPGPLHVRAAPMGSPRLSI